MDTIGHGPFSARAARWLLLVLALTAIWGILAAPAAASTHKRTPPRSLVIHAAFHRLGSAAYVLSSGRYVFAATLNASSPLGSVIDEQTGKRTQLSSLADCDFPTGPEVLGGPWLLVTCSNAQSLKVELYGLSSGRWVTVIPASSIQQFCQAPGMSSCEPVAVGTDWIEFDESCYHCAGTHVFQNIQSGAIRSDPTTATTIVDLNSASLAKPVCRPLRVPRSGSLFFDGSFAVAESSQAAFLERCGTRLHQRIGPVGAQPANSHAIVWQSGNEGLTGAHQLTGLFLPSLRRFVISIPAFVGYPHEIVLSSRHLYVVGGAAERLWMTASPAQPPSR